MILQGLLLGLKIALALGQTSTVDAASGAAASASEGSPDARRDRRRYTGCGQGPLWVPPRGGATRCCRSPGGQDMNHLGPGGLPGQLRASTLRRDMSQALWVPLARGALPGEGWVLAGRQPAAILPEAYGFPFCQGWQLWHIGCLRYSCWGRDGLSMLPKDPNCDPDQTWEVIAMEFLRKGR